MIQLWRRNLRQWDDATAAFGSEGTKAGNARPVLAHATEA